MGRHSMGADDVDVGVQGSHQPDQWLGHAEHHLGAAFADQQGEAAELQGVAQALFPMQEDRPSADVGITEPGRGGEPALGHRGGQAFAPFVALPARAVVAEAQLHQAAVEPGVDVLGGDRQGAGIGRQGAGVVADVLQHVAEIGVGVGVAGVDGHGLLAGGSRFGPASDDAQDIAEVAQRLDVAGAQAAGGLEGGDGIVVAAEGLQRHAAVELGGDIVGADAQGGVEAGQAVLLLAHLAEAVAAVEPDLGVGRVVGAGEVEMRDRLGQGAHGLQQVGIVEVEHGGARLFGDGRLDQCGGACGVAALGHHHAEQVQRVGVTWVLRQHGFVECGGVSEPALLVGGQGLLEEGGDRHWWHHWVRCKASWRLLLRGTRNPLPRLNHQTLRADT